MRRQLMVGLLIACAGTSASAADPLPLPSLALDPPPPPSIWHGFWAGTDIVGVSRSGGKGFFGGDVSAGYDHVFADHTILGLHGATGVTPGWSGFGPVRPYDFATLGASLAYPVGRWTPYVSADLVVAKPNDRLSGGYKALESANDLFNGSEKLDTAGTVGAGFNYALTSDTSVGLGISVHRGAASVLP